MPNAKHPALPATPPSPPDLYLFGDLRSDPVLSDLHRLRRRSDAAAGRRACRAILRYAADTRWRGDPLRHYLIEALLAAPDAGDLIAAPALSDGYLESDAAACWEEFFDVDWRRCCEQCGILPFPAGEAGDPPPAWLRPLAEAGSAEALCAALRAFYARYHDRDEARFEAFRWEDGALRGVDRPERQRFESLAGLEHQKRLLRANAEAFLSGAPAHNVLLVGSSGTGKSSCVKATLTAYAARGLRLVELPKGEIDQLPRLAEALRDKRCKYIVYIDDLSFEEVDAGYKALKVALEGQLAAKPDHMLLYVTSNRRNLVRESWGDRDSEQEIHENDSLHEKRSLSERFGLRLTFGVMNQKEYFEVVRLLLGEQGVAFDDGIAREASAWALTYNGRSGRSARQFVENYLARKR